MFVEDDMKFEQVAHQREQERLALQEASDYINSSLTEVGQMGANDIEPGLLADLLSKLERGEISPAAAKSEACKIVERKNAYH
jgi:hypothetical protein